VHLFIFNLSTDDTDPLLAFTQEWVLAFKAHSEKITVISTHVGEHSLPEEIDLIEIGGGNFIRRVKGFFRIINVGFKIQGTRKTALVFHHMSPRSALILGPFLKLLKVKQGLWYSHSNPSIELRVAAKLVDKIFSSSKQSLPIRNAKARFVGHGIKTSKFPPINENPRQSAVLSLGRVARIKNNEALISAVAESSRSKKEIHLVGPLGGSTEYLSGLIALGKKAGVEVIYLGEAEHKAIPKLLKGYSVCYTGNPNTVDKSVIEGALSGCFTLAAQEFVLDQTGMTNVLRLCNLDFTNNLSTQLEYLELIHSRSDLRAILAKSAAEMNDVDATAQKIIYELVSL
jgi:glycosyltransferase involved in cell wall biosynthesis